MMPASKHQNVRTTLTLDEDVAKKLKSEVRRSGRSFRDVVNDVLRRGLLSRQEAKPSRPFKVEARALGLRPGLSLDSISELLEEVEGPNHR
jgi:plasmid stability protein